MQQAEELMMCHRIASRGRGAHVVMCHFLSLFVASTVVFTASAQETPEFAARGAALLDGDPQAAQSLLALEQATEAAIRRCGPSVVAIARASRQQVPGSQLAPLLSRRESAGGSVLQDPDYVPDFFGTGVVISSDGYIVTCAHVLGDPRQNVYAVWINGTSYPAEFKRKATRQAVLASGLRSAEVLALDAFSDLAVLKVDAERLQPIKFADSADVEQGQFVVTLGNPDSIARDGKVSASWALVSNTQRHGPSPNANSGQDSATPRQSLSAYGTLLQVDCRRPPGTSGGAVVNLDGQMVGLLTSLSAENGQGRAAGFAIAVDALFQRVVNRLKSGRLPEYGFLGIQPDNLSAEAMRGGQSGALVKVVLRNMPGAQAGLKADDVIVSVENFPVSGRNDLFRELSRAGANRLVRMEVERLGVPGQRRMLRAQLSKKPPTSPGLSYAANAPPPWRGMQVDYATALPAELLLAGVFGGRAQRPVLAVTEVQPKTPAWLAGLRPGDGLTHFAGQTLQSPEEFRSLAAQAEGAVSLTIAGSNGSERQVRIATGML